MCRWGLNNCSLKKIKKIELTKYGRKQAAGKLASSCVVVGWQGKSEGWVCLVGARLHVLLGLRAEPGVHAPV